MAAALRLPDPAPPAAESVTALAPPALRFITCGSVDDGKSTLIGRLIFEAGAIPEDVLATLEADSARIGNAEGGLDFALLVDGLQAEREQGITIDVAWRYFATPRRAFIVADTPGHEQYTRNMATGASGADLAVILVDARKGVLPQTRRHSLIVSLVGVRHIVVAINKIDLIGYDADRIRAIAEDYRKAVAGLGFASITVIPVSARAGDNIAAPSPRTPWHDGPTLLGHLEAVRAEAAAAGGTFVLPVQWVNRPNLDFRGFAGTVAAGSLRPGETVTALPSGERAKVTRIVTFDGDLPRAGAGQAVTLTLDREIDVSRGDVLVAAHGRPLAPVAARSTVLVRLLVTADRRIAPGDSFHVQLGTAAASARVTEVVHATDIARFTDRPAGSLGLNDLGFVRLSFDRPLVCAPYAVSRALGALILIDRVTHATAAMGTLMPDGPAGGDARVVPLKRAADRLLAGTLGPDWREAVAPAISWRLGSAGLLGLAVTALTASPLWGVAAALADATLRPALRLAHHGLWQRLRAPRDTLGEGEGI